MDDSKPEDTTIWDLDKDLEKRHPTITDDLDDANNYI